MKSILNFFTQLDIKVLNISTLDNNRKVMLADENGISMTHNQVVPGSSPGGTT